MLKKNYITNLISKRYIDLLLNLLKFNNLISKYYKFILFSFSKIINKLLTIFISYNIIYDNYVALQIIYIHDKTFIN